MKIKAVPGKMSLQAHTCWCSGFHWEQVVSSIPSAEQCPLLVPVPPGWTAACWQRYWEQAGIWVPATAAVCPRFRGRGESDPPSLARHM